VAVIREQGIDVQEKLTEREISWYVYVDTDSK
jgi:hypothetical protein